MQIRGRAKKFATIAGATGLVAASAVLIPFIGVAGALTNPASPGLTTPAGPYTNGSKISVSGAGFEAEQGPSATGNTMTIVECEYVNNTLPSDYTQCDGTTANPNPFVTNASGAFTNFQFTVTAVTTGGGSNINCDATHYCVLWVGADPVGNFSGSSASPIAFSTPFLITQPNTSTPESPATIALPVAAAGVIGGGAFLVFRRRRHHSAAA